MRAPLPIVCVLLGGLMQAAPSRAQVDEDVERALATVRVLAAGGDVVAQFSLGALLYYGGDDLPLAIDWLRRAAGQGYADAEFQIAQLYDFGFGVDQNDRDALVWYRMAAEHGSAAGQRAVGDFYRKGRSITADSAEAARWYGLAAQGDDVRAQYELGQLYFTGTGVALDYGSAYVWFSLAGGQTPLRDNRKALLELRNIAAARMTPDQVTAAEGRLASWKPRAASAR
jgi:TPR repeat protein